MAQHTLSLRLLQAGRIRVVKSEGFHPPRKAGQWLGTTVLALPGGCAPGATASVAPPAHVSQPSDIDEAPATRAATADPPGGKAADWSEAPHSSPGPDHGNVAAPPPGAASVSAALDSAALLRALQQGQPPDQGPLDHSKGKPLRGICDVTAVQWKESPAVFGLEGFVQVADEAEANQRRVRSYAILDAQYVDTTKDGKSDLAVVPVLNWAPDATGAMEQWGEIYLFTVRDCSVGSVLVIKSGPSPDGR